MVQPSNGQPRRSGPNIEAELRRLHDEEAEAVGQIQAWCTLCNGSGMVMEFGPTDCPNLAAHRLINTLTQQRDLLSKREAADLIGVDIRSVNRHMSLGHLDYYSVGGHVIFDRADVVRFKKAYWY